MERKDGERSGGSGTAGGANTPAFLGATDDDDISMFVQEIDARKPLASVAARQPLSAPPDGGVAASPGTASRRGILEAFDPAAPRPKSASPSVSGGTSAALGLGLVAGEHPRRSLERMSASDEESKRSSTSMGPMLTREAEVDERLRHMHEVFLASLEGLGSASGRRRDSASGRSESGSASGLVRGQDSVSKSRSGSRESGAGGLGMGFPSGLGRERESQSGAGSSRSVSAMEAGSNDRRAGLVSRLDAEGDSPR